MPRVALISPRGAEKNFQNNLLRAVYQKINHLVSFVEVDEVEFVPSLGLLSIASYFPPDFELSLIDENYLDLNGRSPENYWGDFDLVALSGFNHQAKRAYQIAGSLRKKNCKVIMGGLHASALPQEAKQFVDSVVVGEAEEILPQLINDFLKQELKPFYYSKGNVDLKAVLPPSYWLVNPAYYNKIPLLATRGCPHHCAFCCLKEAYGAKYRKKTIPQVKKELELVKSLLGDKFITFADENLLVDKKFSKELLRALIPYRITYECYCDSQVAEDEELLRLLKASGCVELLIGFESIEAANLDEMAPWKARRVKKYPAVIERIQKHGIGVVGLFVLGMDRDTPETFARLYDFIEKTGLFDIDLSFLTPIPGSRLYRSMKKAGRLLSEDWDKYTWHNINFKPQNLSPAELKAGKLQLYQQFYQPKAIAERKSRFPEIYSRLKAYGLGR